MGILHNRHGANLAIILILIVLLLFFLWLMRDKIYGGAMIIIKALGPSSATDIVNT